MADEIKFTDEELKSLSELSQNYQNIQSSFGQIRVQKILLEQQGESLDEAEVKMEGNDYYTSMHEKMKIKYAGQKITVEKMGGLECGKCHY